MIDTVVLVLNQDEFRIFRHDRFGPSARWLYSNDCFLGNRGNLSCTQNPTVSELRAGNYRPRLAVTKRIRRKQKPETTLKIEFSAPKLLFGNNFDELDNIDFHPLIRELGYRLEEMGVATSPTALANAKVSAIHYSKNIPLRDFRTPFSLMETLSKVNLNKRLDLNQTDFRNGGQSLKYRTNSFELVYYDKIRDLHKAKMSEKRAEEKQNAIQFKLLERLERLRPFEVLRMELRLNRRQKITQVLRQIGNEDEPLFSNLFRKEIAQKVLLYYFDYFTSDYLIITHDCTRGPERLFAEVLGNNPGIKLRKALQVLATLILLYDLGTRRFRELISGYSDENWYRLNKEMQSLDYGQPKDILAPIRDCLRAFSPVKLPDYTGGLEGFREG